MTERTEDGAAESVDSIMAAVTDETSLVEVFDEVLEISEGAELTRRSVSEETDSREKLQQGDGQEDGQMVCPPAADVITSDSKWMVGAQCRAAWSQDGQVYPATVVAVDGERCTVRFRDYDNEEDVELSALRSPEAAPQTQSPQDWKPGSRCRAVYSEDGLVYPAVVLWVKGQRCRIRFDDYNNEEEQDVGSLLNVNELHGSSTGAVARGSSWRRRRREENQGERGGGERRSPWREDQQNSSWVKDRNQSRVESDDTRRGNQQKDKAEKPTNHSVPFFPPFPPPPTPPPQSGDSLSFLPPLPPLPPQVWMFGGKESGGSVDPASSMLMLWYMCGFHTGSYMAQQMFRSTSKD